jgi:hypothetical protein
VIVLVKAWLAADRPAHNVRLGSFERWSSVVGGIIQTAGIPGFLESLDELYDASDKEGQEWRAFADAWWRALGAEPQKVADLNQFCEREGLMLDLRGDRSERSQQVRLGNALHSHRDQVYERYRIVKVDPPRQHRGTSMYALETRDLGDDTSGTCRDLEGGDPDGLIPTARINCEAESGTSRSSVQISIHEIKEDANSGGEKEREQIEERSSGSCAEIPTLPTRAATPAVTDTSRVGNLGVQIQTPRGESLIDLADFEEERQ